jgi:hypothetical protein
MIRALFQSIGEGWRGEHNRQPLMFVWFSICISLPGAQLER